MHDLIRFEHKYILVLGVERAINTTIENEWPREEFYKFVVWLVDNTRRDLDLQERSGAKAPGEAIRGTQLCSL